ncbi:MAG: hypothetical protein HY701_09115 [Gemmatimonadetes bacterium]|nr:hypothetical protein [Gemmatimonadota bacterium]
MCNEAQRLGVELTDADLHVTITSGIEGTHADDSGHYQLRALDVRSKNFRTRAGKEAFMAGLRRRLGPRYTVGLEFEGKPREHVHIQFDP